MILKKRIPEHFYKLFRTRNIDAYMQILVAIYRENNELYTSLGLTIEECRIVVAELMAVQEIHMLEDEQERDGEEEVQGSLFYLNSPAAIVNKLIRWGWLKKDYDDQLNQHVISFPEYSQLYVELFQRLQTEDDSRERESILSIYSALYTFYSDKEKNNEILAGAVRTSKRLGQMLSNMQDGMRVYFDELSRMKDFLGIQKVLVDELNNSDSRKYAILTTTDSFYRYKESVKELISEILLDNDRRRETLEQKAVALEPGSLPEKRNERSRKLCEETGMLVYQIEREFDVIERKYNKLIEQKTVFAGRALARIQYIMQEGADNEDNIVNFIRLLGKQKNQEQMLLDFGERIGFTRRYHLLTDQSLRKRKGETIEEFRPNVVNVLTAAEEEITDFVPKPLYTRKELDVFRKKYTRDGVFRTTKDTVRTVEDLEKLLFLWQDATSSNRKACVELGEELQTEEGYTFSGLEIRED